MTHSCHKSKERSNTQKKQESIQIKRVKPLQQLVAAAREDEKANPPQLNCFLLPECFSVGPTAVVFQLQWFSHFPQLALLLNPHGSKHLKVPNIEFDFDVCVEA